MTYHFDDREGQAGDEALDMSNLEQPRGKGFSLRIKTPNALVGTTNPWTGKPFGKTLKLGLNTRRHAEAVRIRDVRIGQLRQLEAEAIAAAGRPNIGGIIDLSPENAREWRELRAEEGDKYDHVLTDQLERAAQAGYPREAQRFADVVLKGKLPLDEALDQYLEDRREGNPLGLDPLKPATMADVRSSMKHLRVFMGEGATLADVSREQAFKFMTEYLPLTAKVSPTTVDKHSTHLRGLWAWAITDRRILRESNGAAVSNPWVNDERGVSRKRTNKATKTQKRDAFTADEVTKLFNACPDRGAKKADILRLALATGVRADEVASLELMHVEPDGAGFTIPDGKTHNARRFIPLVEDAQRLLRERVIAAAEAQEDRLSDERRLFPEWPQRPSNGKASAVSQWFTRFRRDTLGADTDGRLVMHSFRHTWATLAKQAGVPRDIRQELGGWAKEKEAMDVYDHGLERKQLREWQQKVWDALKEAGYLEAF